MPTRRLCSLLCRKGFLHCSALFFRYLLKANKKAWHSTDDHPKRIALDVDIPQCLRSCSSFRRKAEELLSLLPPDLQHRQNIIHFSSPPWQQKKPPSSPQMHRFPSLYLAPFKSSTKRFVMGHQHTNKLLLSINFKVFTETSNRLPTKETTFSLLAYGLVTTLP